MPYAPPLDKKWPVEFSAEVKALVVIRHQAIPGAGGPPVCWQCGEPIMGKPDFHHRKKQRKGGWAGDGRPSNCLPSHNRFDGGQCHFRMIHDVPASARANGWIIRTQAPLIAYRSPLLVAARLPGLDLENPWIVLRDDGGWHAASPAEMAGDYEAAAG